MNEDRYPQFTKDRLIEIATQALHELIEVDNEAANTLIEDLCLSLEEMEFFGVIDEIEAMEDDEYDD